MWNLYRWLIYIERWRDIVRNLTPLQNMVRIITLQRLECSLRLSQNSIKFVYFIEVNQGVSSSMGVQLRLS